MASLAGADDSGPDMAYKYPFLQEAKELVSRINPGFDTKSMEQGRIRLEEALSKKRIGFHKANIGSLKYAYLMSYVYARMLVSALNNRGLVSRYVDAESKRAASAIKESGRADLQAIADRLDAGMSAEGECFTMRFEKYLQYAPSSGAFALSMQELGGGTVRISEAVAIGVLRRMIRREMAKNLPIPRKDLPREIIEYSKKVAVPPTELLAEDPNLERRYAWIDKLLAMPIPDVRHRTVNLILAPYLTNVRKLSESEAAKIIIDYIERCKEIDPNTKVNESYIRYQCKYSKGKGMKPLSLSKAKELLGSLVDADRLSGA